MREHYVGGWQSGKTGLLQQETLRANARRAFRWELSPGAEVSGRVCKNDSGWKRGKWQIGLKKISVEIERESG